MQAGAENPAKEINMVRDAKDFGLKIGDVLSAGWGYEAELYNFYEVVGFTKTFVKVRELKKVGAEGETSYPMYYGRLVKPVTVGDDRFVGYTFARKPFNFNASNDPSKTFLAIDSFRYAYPWDGKPCDEYNAH